MQPSGIGLRSTDPSARVAKAITVQGLSSLGTDRTWATAAPPAKVLAVALSSLRVGDRVALTLSHGGEERTLDLVVGERPVPRQDLPESGLEALATGVSRPPAGGGSRFVPGGRQSF